MKVRLNPMALKNFIKENFVLAVGLTLPLLLVVLFFFASVLPKSMATPPQHEMIFATTRYDAQNQPAYGVDFFVRDNALRARVTKRQPNAYINQRRIMAYDGRTQTVRELPYDTSKIGDMPDGTEIIFDEFRNLQLDSNNKAPDGYEFDNAGYGHNGLVTEFFGGYRNRGARVKKGAVAFKIPNSYGGNYYYYDVQFLGWVIKK